MVTRPRVAVHLDQGAVGDPTGRIGDRDRAGDAEFPADDDGVTHHCADIDDDRVGGHEQRGPGRVGDGGDQHLAGCQTPRVRRVEHHPRPTPADAAATRQALEDLAPGHRGLRSVPQLPGLERWLRALEEEGRYAASEFGVHRPALGNGLGEARRGGQVVVHLGLDDEPEVTSLPAALLPCPAVDLHRADPGAVDGSDDRGLAALPAP